MKEHLEYIYPDQAFSISPHLTSTDGKCGSPHTFIPAAAGAFNFEPLSPSQVMAVNYVDMS